MRKKDVHKLLLPFLILIWLLFKVGFYLHRFFTKLLSLLTDLLANLGASFYKISSQTPKLKVPNFHLDLPKKNKKKGRGRPRSRPIFTYLFKYKFHPVFHFIKVFIPSPLRMVLILSFIGIMFFFYSVFLVLIASQLPSPTKLSDTNGPLTTTIYDRNGEVLYRFYDDKNRTLVTLSDLPADLIHATVSIEDKNFYQHSGVDLEGVARAAIAYIHNEPLQGGSTITQQLIKNTLLTPERTWQRKVKEMVLAFWTEKLFTKDDILKMYFNEVAYGGPAWGIAAASQTYFNKNPSELDLAESAYLAGLTASPTTYSPYGSNPELGKQRQREVLRRMVEDGYLTQSQSTDAYQEPLKINPPLSQIKAPHFVMYVKQLLAQKYGEKMVSQGGLKVYTSLDLNMQQMAEDVVSQEVDQLSYLDVGNGAAMITDATNGQILAMVGTKNYYDPNGGNVNVTTSPRQPGSSIKPITYATAFKMGYSPATILLDNPVVFKNPWETYAPVNYDGKFHGAVTMRTALGSSFNIPAVKTLYLIGIPNMLRTAHDMGITDLNDTNRYGLSLTLGGGEVKLIDMMTVYGTFSQMGIKHDPEPILKVVDADGEVLEEAEDQGKRVLPAGVAYLVTDILADNKARTPAFGSNSLLQIPGYTVAVKTGTTDNKKDNWTLGYTPKYVVGVWVGNLDSQPMNPQLTSGVTGAAPIWNKIMNNLLQGQANLSFAKPAEVIEGTVDGRKDLVIAGNPPKSVVSPRKSSPQPNQPGDQNISFTDPFSSVNLPPQP